jgi:cytoskeletal protein RodZ
MKSIGQQLREARVARKMTLEAASKATKIKVEQLMELENNNYSRFAAPAYARGFIRIYARMLGLDEHRLIDQLDGFIDEQDEEIFLNSNPVNYIPDEPEDKNHGMTNREVGMMIAGGVMLCIIGVLAYKVFWVDALESAPAAASIRANANVSPSINETPAKPVEEPVAVAVPVNPWAINQEGEEVKKAMSVIPRATPLNENVPIENTPNDPPIARAVAVGDVPEDDIEAPRAISVNTVVPGASGAIAGTASATSSPRPADGLRQLVLLASEDCWVRVTEITKGEAKHVFADQMLVGEKKQFRAERFIVTAGIPAALRVFLDDKDLGILSEERLPSEFHVPKLSE